MAASEGPEMRLTVSTNAALGMTANNNSTSFWKVTAVRPGSQAEHLGIRVGYYISSIGGKKLTAEENLESIMREVKSSADTYELIIIKRRSDSESTGVSSSNTPNATDNSPEMKANKKSVTNGCANNKSRALPSTSKNRVPPEPSSGSSAQRAPAPARASATRSAEQEPSVAAVVNRASGKDSASSQRAPVPAPVRTSASSSAQHERPVTAVVGDSTGKSFASRKQIQSDPVSKKRVSDEGPPVVQDEVKRYDLFSRPTASSRRSSELQESPAGAPSSDALKWQRRKAVIPTKKGADVALYGDIWEVCEERVKKVCNEYCLLPPCRRHLLTAAVNLVFSSLCYDAPKCLVENDSEHWILGLKPHLHGPQPWMLTRKFIIQKIEAMLEADEIDWLISSNRKEELLGKQMPIIKRFLITWKAQLESASQSAVLEKYATRVWKRFTLDHFAGGDVNVLHKLTESYVHVVAAKLEQKKMCPPVHGKSGALSGSSSQALISQLDQWVLTKLKEIQFELVPFVTDLGDVKDSILERLQTNFVQLDGINISKSLIRSTLDDLEVDGNYLSTCNELWKVRVRLSGLDSRSKQMLLPDFIGNVDSCSEEEEEEDVPAGEELTSSVQTKGTAPAAVQGISDEEDCDGHYSSAREIGARVYAEFTNGDYYWGTIASVNENRKTQEKKYTVHFEDGDILESISSTAIYTEKEYIKIFMAEPPEPAYVSSRDRRRSRRVSTTTSSETTKKRRSGTKRAGQRSQKEESLGANPTERERKKTRQRLDEGVAETERKRSKLERKHTQTGAPNAQKPKHEKKQASSSDNKTDFVPPSNIAEHMREGCLTPRELRKRRCKQCALCFRGNCGQCSTCLRNRSIQKGSSKGGKEVCLRKMCCRIPIPNKSLPALGFSLGWAFVFEEPTSTFRSIDAVSTSPGLTIFAPDDRKFKSVENAAIHDGSATSGIETICQQFCAHIGASSYQSDPDHFLVGKGFCHDWISVEGRHRVLFGTIARCVKDTTEAGETHFVVEYSDESRSLLHTISNGLGRSIPPSEEILSAAAWGGCVAFERKTHIRRGPGSVVKSIDRTIPCESWVTPDVREEIKSKLGIGSLPMMVITFRGYKLSFSVRKSTIPGAGLGVFCRCTSLTNNTSSRGSDSSGKEPFDLKAGEMLDLGVYAPFRAEDKKHRTVFHLKNYIFSLSCEEWCFNAPDAEQQYDITDDRTGTIHAIARSHIMTFVNECGPKACPNVYARVDPEGGVHYLMGVAYYGVWNDFEVAMKQLGLKAGGNEIELFVDYGTAYENVRVRKGYSSLDEEQQAKRRQRMPHYEKAFVLEISQYSKEDLSRTIGFLLNSFCPEEGEISGKVRDRALEVSWRLRARIEELKRDTLPELDHLLVSLDDLNKRLCALACDRQPPNDYGNSLFSPGDDTQENIPTMNRDDSDHHSESESDTSYEYNAADSSSEGSNA